MRNHSPCRECGCKHTNPASSTLCCDCGALVGMRNQKERQEQIDIENRAQQNQEDYHEYLITKMDTIVENGCNGQHDLDMIAKSILFLLEKDKD